MDTDLREPQRLKDRPMHPQATSSLETFKLSLILLRQHRFPLLSINTIQHSALYQWLHETMRLAGKTLDPTEWCLYVTRAGTPCLLYTSPSPRD